MRLPIYQIDAFADRSFAGNPAAVCPLDAWLDDDMMQSIAQENNLSETAFFVPEGDKGHYHLRWFTPADEVDLCGHATLASAYVLLTKLAPELEEVSFRTRSGVLTVTRAGSGLLSMNFPALKAEPVTDGSAEAIMDRLEKALGKRPAALLRSVNLLAVYETEADLHGVHGASELGPYLMEADSWGLIVTAPPRRPRAEGGEHDFLSRFFAPMKGVPEDPVTGSAHCTLMPYWAERLGQSELIGYQASTRGGTVHCTHVPGSDRVTLAGTCVPFFEGVMTIA